MVISEKVFVFASHLLDYSSAVFSFFFRRKWKGKESGFGKVVRLKGIVNDWRSNGWGCGEPSIRAPENEVRIKANVYLWALLLLKLPVGWFPLNNTLWQEEALFPPAGANGLSGKDIWSFFCHDVDILESAFVNFGPLMILIVPLPQTLVKCKAPSLCCSAGLCSGFFFLPRCTFSPSALNVMSHMTFPWASWLIRKVNPCRDKTLCISAFLNPSNFVTCSFWTDCDGTETSLSWRPL